MAVPSRHGSRPEAPAWHYASARAFPTPAPVERHILIVDDYEPWFRCLTRLLQRNNYQTVCARNGHEALNHLKKGPLPNLIVLEMALPVMDGWTFRREQTADPRLSDIPVVVVTAVGEREKPVAPPDVAAAYLKPIDVFLLLDTVARVTRVPGTDCRLVKARDTR